MGVSQSNETKYLLQVEGDYSELKMVPYFARFDSTPFAEGSMRWCYAGIVLSDKGKMVYPDSFPDGRCVVKSFKEGCAVDAQEWTDDYKNSFYANAVAAEFNKAVPTTRPLKFAVPYVAQIDTRAGAKVMGITMTPDDVKGKLESREWVAIEPFIVGEYKKFTSNSGWIDPHIGNAIPAFMHWGWVHSKGQVLVSDIQGVRRDTCYMLTDPAVQSVDRHYGATDLGAEGLVRFLTTHKHTELCKALPWPSDEEIRLFKALLTTKPIKHTTFSFQLPNSVRNDPTLQVNYKAFIDRFFK